MTTRLETSLLKAVTRASLIILLIISQSASAAWFDRFKRPTTSAEKIRITFTADANPENIIPIRILEGIEIWPAKNQRNITHYNVYWGDVARNKLGLFLAPRLARIPANKSGEKLVHEFAPNLKMEAGAIYVLVCSANRSREFCGKDNNLERVTDDLIGALNTVNRIKRIVSENGNLAGVEVMKTCGDLICNGVETRDSCPADCTDYGLASFNFQVLCQETKGVFHPRSTAEVQQLINGARANGLRVKISSGRGPNNTAGSASTLICTDGIVLVMDQFEHDTPGLETYLEDFEGQQVVNVAGGTNLHDLSEWLYQRDLGLGYVHLGWRHVSVAGAIATSAHGSSPRRRNILAHSVVGLDVVTANGQLTTFSKWSTGVDDPDLWKALTTHLGYLGVVTRVRLEVQPATNTQVKITFHQEDELFEDNPVSVLEDIQECDYGQYNWFPSLNKYLRTCGKTTPANGELGANNRLLFPFVDQERLPTATLMQFLQVGSVDTTLGAHETMEDIRHAGWHLTPPLVKRVNGQTRHTTNAIGPTHRMISSELINTLDRETFQMDWEVAVPQHHIQGAMEYVKRFTDGLNLRSRNIPAPLIGIFVRFSKVEDNTLMAYTGTGNGFANGSIAAHIEFPIYVPVDLDKTAFDDYIGTYEEAMRVLITQFGARGHWGKNMHSHDPWLFELQNNLGVYGNRVQRFSQQVAKLDPKGMFANRFAKAIGITYPDFDYPQDW